MSDQDKTKADEQATTESDPGNADGVLENTADSKVSRRRALIAGLAAAPVVLTLMGRSAFANTINCSVAQSVIAGTSLHPRITKDYAQNHNNCPL